AIVSPERERSMSASAIGSSRCPSLGANALVQGGTPVASCCTTSSIVNLVTDRTGWMRDDPCGGDRRGGGLAGRARVAGDGAVGCSGRSAIGGVTLAALVELGDLEITSLVHRALSAVRDAGRWGDRKVFIVALWTTMLAIEAATSGTLTEGCTIAHFQAWLLRARLLTRDGTQEGARLVVLCRADLVAAMDPALVAASETVTDGAAFHFVLDPRIAVTEY